MGSSILGHLTNLGSLSFSKAAEQDSTSRQEEGVATSCHDRRCMPQSLWASLLLPSGHVPSSNKTWFELHIRTQLNKIFIRQVITALNDLQGKKMEFDERKCIVVSTPQGQEENLILVDHLRLLRKPRRSRDDGQVFKQHKHYRRCRGVVNNLFDHVPMRELVKYTWKKKICTKYT